MSHCYFSSDFCSWVKVWNSSIHNVLNLLTVFTRYTSVKSIYGKLNLSYSFIDKNYTAMMIEIVLFCILICCQKFRYQTLRFSHYTEVWTCPHGPVRSGLWGQGPECRRSHILHFHLIHKLQHNQTQSNTEELKFPGQRNKGFLLLFHVKLVSLDLWTEGGGGCWGPVGDTSGDFVPDAQVTRDRGTFITRTPSLYYMKH